MSPRLQLPLWPVLAVMVLPACSPSGPPGMKEQQVPVATAVKAHPALLSVDRLKMGLPPLPTNGTVRILTVDRKNWKREYPPPNYDMSFQFYGGTGPYPYTSRFVALAQTNGAWQWVCEQVTFTGPKLFIMDDQTLNEFITIANETRPVIYQGTNIQGTLVSYSGPDTQLAPKGRHAEGLPLSQIGPVLRKWGYSYDGDGGQRTEAGGQKPGMNEPPARAK